MEDADAIKNEGVTNQDGPHPPGAMPIAQASQIPDWYKVGWRQVGGIDKAPAEGEAIDEGVLDAFLADQYYGAWYHNAAIIIFVSILSYLTY